MSLYYSKFDLNTYAAFPYFRSQLPEGYPLGIVLTNARAFRRLPPNLRKLAALAKRWAIRVHGHTPGDIDRYYDKEGYELNPNTGQRLSDADIDAMWGNKPGDRKAIVDIPVPDGGFDDPDTWNEPEDEPEEDDPERITEKDLLRDIKSHGRKHVLRYYNLPVDKLGHIESDEELARAIMGLASGDQ